MANVITINTRDDLENEGRKHVALIDDPACLRQVMRRRPNVGGAAPQPPAPVLEPKEIWVKMLIYKPLRSMRKCPSGKTNQERIFILDDTVKVIANFDPNVYSGNVWFVVEKGKTKKCKLWKRRWSELIQSLRLNTEHTVYERYPIIEHGEVRQNAKAHFSPAIVPHIFCNLVRLCQDGEVWFQSGMFPHTQEEMHEAASASVKAHASSSSSSSILPALQVPFSSDDSNRSSSSSGSAAKIPSSTVLKSTRSPTARASIPTPMSDNTLIPSQPSLPASVPPLSLSMSPLTTPRMRPATYSTAQKAANPLLNSQVFPAYDNDDIITAAATAGSDSESSDSDSDASEAESIFYPIAGIHAENDADGDLFFPYNITINNEEEEEEEEEEDEEGEGEGEGEEDMIPIDYARLLPCGTEFIYSDPIHPPVPLASGPSSSFAPQQQQHDFSSNASVDPICTQRGGITSYTDVYPNTAGYAELLFYPPIMHQPQFPHHHHHQPASTTTTTTPQQPTITTPMLSSSSTSPTTTNNTSSSSSVTQPFRPSIPESPYKTFIPLNPGTYFQEEKGISFFPNPIDDALVPPFF